MNKVPIKFVGGRKAATFSLLFKKGSTVPEVQFLRGDESFRDAAAAIAATKFDVLFPDDAPTKLFRWGTLACNGGPTQDCILSLEE